MTRNKILFSVFGLSALMALSACQRYTQNIQHVTASQIARPAFMVERIIPSANHNLYAWERMHYSGESANIYIEGTNEDNPVALHLASRDNSKNLAYLAQPCQYDTTSDEVCQGITSVDHTTSVIESYNAASDEMRARYRITSFNLIGYDTGANIASLLAAERNDILSLRTVTGDFTPAGGISAVNIAPSLANMKQHHFLGAADDVITPEEYHAYRQAMGPSGCVNYTMVQDADHEKGWVEKWPTLLGYPLECEAEAFEDYTPEPFPPAKDRKLTK